MFDNCSIDFSERRDDIMWATASSLYILPLSIYIHDVEERETWYTTLQNKWMKIAREAGDRGSRGQSREPSLSSSYTPCTASRKTFSLFAKMHVICLYIHMQLRGYWNVVDCLHIYIHILRRKQACSASLSQTPCYIWGAGTHVSSFSPSPSLTSLLLSLHTYTHTGFLRSLVQSLFMRSRQRCRFLPSHWRFPEHSSRVPHIRDMMDGWTMSLSREHMSP